MSFIKCRLKFCSKVSLQRCHLQTWLFWLISSWWWIRKQRVCRSAVRKVQDSLTDCISILSVSKQNDQERSSFLVDVAVKNVQRNFRNWVKNLLTVLWVNRMTIQWSTELTSYYILYKMNAVLLIKLDVLIWYVLSWNKV